MVNRRIGQKGRLAQKKKLKISKRLLASGGRTEEEHSSAHDDESRPAAVPRGSAAVAKRNRSKRDSGTSSKAKKALTLAKQRSEVLKRQATERMVLKEHLRELKERRLRTRKGDDAKTERRELGKYIRQLDSEQKKKHAAELENIGKQMKKSARQTALAGYDGVAGRDDVNEDELRDMFAHLVA